MKNFLLWILTTGLISAAEIRKLKEDLVHAMGMSIQSENALRIDLVNLTNTVRENTKEVRELNNYFKEIKQSREIQYHCPKCGNGMKYEDTCSQCGHYLGDDDSGKADEKPKG